MGHSYIEKGFCFWFPDVSQTISHVQKPFQLLRGEPIAALAKLPRHTLAHILRGFQSVAAGRAVSNANGPATPSRARSNESVRATEY